jgi:hypothetical protein
LRAKNDRKHNKTARTIYQWIFSSAQPSYCKSEEEYHLSKALLMKFVQLHKVKDLFGSGFVDSVVTFVRGDIFPHEEIFCYYKRHSLFHLETHSNYGHEGKIMVSKTAHHLTCPRTSSIEPSVL